MHELPGSPQNLLVSAADADARGSSIFEGETPLRHKTLVAGTTMSAYLQVGDRFSNPTQPKEGELIVQLQGPRGRRRLLPTALSMAPQEEALDSTVHANELDSPRVSDGVRSAAGTPRGSLTSPRGLRPKSPSPLTQSGTYGLFEVREQLDLSGSYTLSATVLGEHVGGSPIELQITPAPLDALHSVLIPPPDAAIVHQPSTFVVQPRDSWGNAPPVADLVEAVASGAVVARVDGPTRPKCSIKARTDGSIDVTVLVQLSGDYRLHVWLSGAQLSSCPFPLRVHPNHSHAQRPPHQGSACSTSRPSPLSGDGSPGFAWWPSSSRPSTSPRSARTAGSPSPRAEAEDLASGSPRGVSLRASSLVVTAACDDFDGPRSAVFSPRLVIDSQPPPGPTHISPRSANIVPAHPPSTPRARSAAVAAATDACEAAVAVTAISPPLKRAVTPPARKPDMDYAALTVASPRTSPKAGGRRSARVRPMSSGAYTPYETEATAEELGAADAAFAHSATAMSDLWRAEVRSPGTLRSPRWTEARAAQREAARSRTYGAAIEARGGPRAAW